MVQQDQDINHMKKIQNVKNRTYSHIMQDDNGNDNDDNTNSTYYNPYFFKSLCWINISSYQWCIHWNFCPKTVLIENSNVFNTFWPSFNSRIFQ